MSRKRYAPRAIFAWPVLLAVVTLIGLVVALAGDGLPDMVSWAALAAPVAAWVWARKTRRT